MPTPPPVTIAERGDGLECAIHAVSSWDDFDKLLRFLEKHHQATIMQCIDGPDARIALLDVDGTTLELHHEDPWGNSLVSPTTASNQALRQIAADLKKRLTGL